MESIQTLLPRFDASWIAECEMVVTNSGGKPPHIIQHPYPGEPTYAYPSVLDEENQASMAEYLKGHDSDIASRFAVLRYLWAASMASVPSKGGWAFSDDGGIWKVDDDQGDLANEAMTADAQKVLADFVDRLRPESITTAEQAMWEFKQAVILFRWERLKRLAEQYRKLMNQSSDAPNLMLARALWLPNGKFWASFILKLVSGNDANDLPWDDFIERGYQGNHFVATCAPPELHEAAISRDSVIDAIACSTKVRPEILGPHWGIVADCWAMAGAPEECAKIWEQHGLEILQPAADATGRPADEVLLLPSYQLGIADLWAAARHTDKEIEVLESLRRRHPRLAGVNRRLAECYLQTDKPDPDAATQRLQDEAFCDEAFSEDPIVRLLLRQCGRAEEADRQRREAQEKYENSPASGGQRIAIQNVLQLAWKPFAGLSPAIQQDWVKGLHWCYGEHTPGIDETERAEEAIYRCCRALESHLREKVFEPLREAAPPTEIKLLPNAFEPLRSFLEKRSTIALTVMLDAVSSAGPSVSGVIKRLWDVLGKGSSKPYELKNKKYLAIALIRNPNVHESRPMLSGLTLGDARRCIELCTEFLSALETPPLPPRPGQPGSTFQGR